MSSLPSDAAGWVRQAVETGQRAYDETWKDGKLPEPLRHVCLANLLVHSCIEATLWEALRLANPAAADALAADTVDLCEAGDAFGELLWEWRERLQNGKPISGSEVYEDVWRRVGLTGGAS
jgi:hypothetical protein